MEIILVMMIFLISLARAAERRAESLALLEKHHLKYELVEAYDGWREHDLSRHHECWPIRSTEVAAFYSHAKAMSRVLDWDLPRGLILEDDFAMRPGFDSRKFAEGLPEDCDFGSLHDLVVPDWEYEIGEHGNSYHRLRRYGLMAMAYIVSARFVRHFLDQCIPCRMPIDHQFRQLSENRNHLRYYQAAAPAFTGRDVPTTL